MAEKLLPCPFCGASASIERLGDRSRSTIYQCDSCSCSLETGEEWGHGSDWNRRTLPPSIRDFLGKVQGVCMGVAMSGRDHPNTDGALMELFNEAQTILFPSTPTEGGAE